MTQTLTTDQLRARAAHLRAKADQWRGQGYAGKAARLDGDADALDELAANREAQPVYQCRFFTTDVDGKQIGEWQDMDKGFYDQYDPYCRRILYTTPPAAVNLPRALFSDKGLMVPLEKVMAALAVCGIEYDKAPMPCDVADMERPAPAMLAQPVSQGYKLVPHDYRELVNSLRDTAVKYSGTDQLREQLSRTLKEKGLSAAAPEGGNG
ncbi:hypothetical protein SERVES_01684 [Serratia ficaria]|uniref:hypothetical protein n=1 Tax=Serratia ficaria TaxID=61651 RepID=UPI00119BD403|nr:hypothetical protein [Serratia ficaria]VVA47963.1 hypothetical protein SERVES_01684 [Serratia ficaria]